MKHPLDGELKEAFLLATITLAGGYGRFLSSLAVTDELGVSDEIVASGAFADVKSGVYENSPVAGLVGFARE